MRNPLKSRPRNARLALTGAAVAAMIAIPSAVAAASTTSPAHPATAGSPAPKATIVIEHGAWADGASFDGVVTRLQRAGYTVDVPPNPLRGPGSVR